MKPRSFNPLDYSSLSEMLAMELMASDLIPLSELEKFGGSGVYALFYDGDFPAYRGLSDVNRRMPGSLPIYVGSAGPKAGKGKSVDISAFDSIDAGTALYKRLREHRNSICKAVNLDIDDFDCRALVLNAVWVSPAEAALIAKYVPVWNAILTGFGNHREGQGRKAGKISRWDSVHPGRGRDAGALPDWKPEDLEDEVADAIKKRVGILGLAG